MELKPCEKFFSERNGNRMAGENSKVGPETEWQEVQRHRLGPSSLRVEMNDAGSGHLEDRQPL